MAKPRIRVNQRGQITQFGDGFASFVNGLGAANAKVAGATYVRPILTEDELSAAYEASTWFGKIVDIPADDATREWRNWQADAKQIEAIEKAEKALRLRQAVRQARIWARLYGGAVIVPLGLPGHPGASLSIDRVGKGAIKALTVMTRHEISAHGMIRDPFSPYYGQPEYYQINTANAGQIAIHPSRVIRFIGRKVKARVSQEEAWGSPIFAHLQDAVRGADTASAVIEALLHEAKVDVVHLPNMMTGLATPEYEQILTRRWTIAAALKGMSNILMLDGDDKWDQKTMTWTGLPDVHRTMMEVLAGASDIPLSRLLGIQQAGLSGSDVGSLRNYYSQVRAEQELQLEPEMAPLDEMLIRSALGSRPDDVWYSWAPLYHMTEKEAAEVDKLEAEAAAIYAREAIVPTEALEKAVQARMIEGGRWPGLEQALEDIPEDAEGDDGAEEDARTIGDAAPRTLYVRRDVLNGAEIIAWAKGQGFATTLPAEDLHVTIAFSRAPVDWMKIGEAWQSKMELAEGGPRLMEVFGEAKVLLFRASELEWRHESILAAGASWDHPEFQPHITISYGDMPDGVQPYQGKIILGPERFEEVKEDWGKGIVEE